MDDTEMSRSLLAQLSWWFHPRMEEVAVEALAYILNRYPASRGGLNERVLGRGWRLGLEGRAPRGPLRVRLARRRRVHG